MTNRRPWKDIWREIVALQPMILQGCDLTPSDDGWVTIYCPLHHDENPSLRVNIETGGTKCMSQGCDVGNLHQLENIILDTTNKRRRGKRPKDILGDLAERRMLDVNWLTETFGVDRWARGYCIPIDDPEVDPDITIDYDIEGLDKRVRHTLQKRGAWLDPKITTCPKYLWQPGLSKSGRHSYDLVYNLTRVKDKLSKEKEVYVVAGAPDVWVMHRAGIPAISFLAGEGSTPSDAAVNKVVEAGIKSVVVVYDNDDAGVDGANDVAITFSENGVQSAIKLLPEDMAKGADLTDLWTQCEGDTEKFSSAVFHLREKEAWAAEVVKPTPKLQRTAKHTGLPEECWVPPFSTYRDALAKTTEAADEYHFFSLMTIIGALLGRRIYVDYGKPLYPNQFTCLTGETGGSRKSTAMHFAFDVMNEVDPDLKHTEASGSAEGLLEAMAFADAPVEEVEGVKAMMGWGKSKKKKNEDDPQSEYFDESDLEAKGQRRLIIRQDEFTALLSKAKSSRTNLIPHLLSAFDCPKEIRVPTRTRPLVVVNPAISILSGTTVEFLGEHFDDMDWYSGFGNRIMFVEGETKERIPLPSSPDEGLWDQAVRYIFQAFHEVITASEEKVSKGGERDFSRLQFKMDDAATEMWEEHYTAWHEMRVAYAPDQRASSQRTSDYALKFAMIYAALRPENAQVVSAEDVDFGWKAALHCERTTIAIVGGLMSEKAARWQEQITDFLRLHQPSGMQHGVKKRDLQQALRRIPAADLNRIIQSLVELRVIREVGRHELRLFE